MNLVKLPFLLVNLLFLVVSLALLALGIYVLSDETVLERVISLSNLTEILKLSSSANKAHQRQGLFRNGSLEDPDPVFLQNFTDPISYLLILIGSLLFFLSFIGYCGAVKDSRCLVATFGVVLGLVVVAEVVGVSLYFFVFKPDVKSYLSQGLQNHYNPSEYPSGPGTRFTVLLDYLMIEHGCCGISGDSDFHPIYDRHRTRFPVADPSQRIPEACCRLNVTDVREVNAIYESILMTINGEEQDPRLIKNRRELLQFAEDPSCSTGHRADSAYLGEENGCFDKIQTDWGMLICVAGVVLGALQLSGVVFSVFVFRAAFYDFHG